MAHLRFAFHERPAATVTCLVRVADGAVAEARIAVGSVGARPVRAGTAEALLVSADPARLGDGVLDEAGRLAAQAAEPDTDPNGSAEYKADLVRVLVGRALREAMSRAVGDAAAT